MDKFRQDRVELGARVASCLRMENDGDFTELYVKRLALRATREARAKSVMR